MLGLSGKERMAMLGKRPWIGNGDKSVSIFGCRSIPKVSIAVQR